MTGEKKVLDKIEKELTTMCIKAKDDKEELFRRDNALNESLNLVYSDRYMKALGYELGIRAAIEVLEKYF